MAQYLALNTIPVKKKEMDFEAEASKFDELVQKVGSIFCQFPFDKEYRLAILGLSDVEDLNKAMEKPMSWLRLDCGKNAISVGEPFL